MYQINHYFVIYEDDAGRRSDYVEAVDGYEVRRIIMNRTWGRARIVDISRA